MSILVSPVERMVGVDRQAVVANGAPIAMRIIGPFALVAIAAKRLQRPKPELVPIAAVPRVMIGDRRGNGEALPLAQGA
jgi:hypothetical protein